MYHAYETGMPYYCKTGASKEANCAADIGADMRTVEPEVLECSSMPSSCDLNRELPPLADEFFIGTGKNLQKYHDKVSDKMVRGQPV